jgi:agmatine deiminase
VKDRATHERVVAWATREGVHNLALHDIPPADVWFRDYGPLFVKRPAPGGRAEVAMTKWRFNAWGGKYDSLLPDDAIPHKLQPKLGFPLFEAGIVMEGGSIEVNGRGTLLTTRQCLLNKNRNPTMSQPDIERKLADFLGVRHFLWLGEGIEGDDTDGHVDDVARFVAPGVVVAAVEDDADDPNHVPLRENLEALRGMVDQDGAPLTVVELPMPGFVEDGEGGRLPASYANFYIGNGAVLLPTFGHANDERATRIVQKLFPTRAVVPIRAEDLVFGMGTFHCVTQQQPAAVDSAP